AGTVTIGERADREAGDAPEHQIHRERCRDRSAAPAEGLGEDWQEHAVRRERGRDSVGDDEERGYDQPATRGRAHAETSITCSSCGRISRRINELPVPQPGVVAPG